MSKEIGKDLLKEAGRQEASRAATRVTSVQRRFTTGLTRFVPTRLRWVFPFVQQRLQIKSPSLQQFRAKLPLGLFKKDVETNEPTQLAPEIETEATPLLQPVKPIYPKYRCVRGNPLSCELPHETLEERPKAKFCQECGFPVPLTPDTRIQGIRGTYQIESFFQHREMGRLYKGIQLSDRQPVILKEYLLPKRYFNSEEARQRKENFMLFAGLNLADGRVKDLRLITPWEAIAPIREERCYLVTKGTLETFPTLASYLLETGALTSTQVREVLRQVLQTLEFLHGQKFRLRSGVVKIGLAHGNLSLNTLLIVPNFQGFFIYLCDLGLWEHQFYPPLSEFADFSPTQDLEDLGYIAFYLLAGTAIDPVKERPLDPRIEESWPLVNPDLKDFILSLMGLGSVRFDSAESARQALLKLPSNLGKIALMNPGPEALIAEPSKDRKIRRSRQIRRFIFTTLGLLLLGFLIWWLIGRRQQSISNSEPLCCIDKVTGIPVGKFTYTAPRDGTWSYVLEQNNLIAKGTTLQEQLRLRLNPDESKEEPQLDLTYLPQSSSEQALEKFRSGQVDFAITSLVSAQTHLGNFLHREVGYEKIGYDGLVVFVPFSYSRRGNGIPEALNGKITFEQLRQIYNGDITNWQQLGGPDLDIKLYVPKEDEAVRIFEQIVLKDRQAIAQFRQQLETRPNPGGFLNNTPPITVLSTFEMLRTAIEDFEDRNIGSIGFAPISKVFGQCSVYPLAIEADNQPAIAPLIYTRNEQPVTPATDLCNDKGSYVPNTEAFTRNLYPLAYPLVVVYPRDNRLDPAGEKFAQILKTIEAQRLLGQTGLIPLEPLPPR